MKNENVENIMNKMKSVNTNSIKQIKSLKKESDDKVELEEKNPELVRKVDAVNTLEKTDDKKESKVEHAQQENVEEVETAIETEEKESDKRLEVDESEKIEHNNNQSNVEEVKVEEKKVVKAKENTKSDDNKVVTNNLNLLENFERSTRIQKFRETYTIKNLYKLWKKDELNFELAIQRNEVWNREQRTKLIFSVLYGYYIPPVIAEMQEDSTILHFLDGKQRLTTIMRFIDGEWALAKDMYINGVNLGGYKFADLPEDVQDIIFDEQIEVMTMKNMTEEERDQQFVFLNMGSALTQMEKTRAMYSELIEDINEISQSEFLTDVANLTTSAKKRLADQEVVLQIAMLLEQGKDVKGLGSVQIRNYVLNLKEEGKLLEKDTEKTIVEVMSFLTQVSGNMTEEAIKSAFKKIHIPMIFMIAKKEYEQNGLDIAKQVEFADFLTDFYLDSYSKESAYGMACQAGSAKKENVLIRLNEIEKAYERYIK